MIAGIDFSSKAVDVVLLDEDSDAATWHRVSVDGPAAFDRARLVRRLIVGQLGAAFWDDVLAVGIEDPRGYGAGSLYRIQGAILSCIPLEKLVQPWVPSAWRKQVGLPGNASKAHVKVFADAHRLDAVTDFDEGEEPDLAVWPFDPCDAYCIALATRGLIERVAA